MKLNEAKNLSNFHVKTENCLKISRLVRLREFTTKLSVVDFWSLEGAGVGPKFKFWWCQLASLETNTKADFKKF